LEPFRTIKQLPGHFLAGIALIALGVVAINLLLYDRNFSLCIVMSSCFQGSAGLLLFESAFHKLERRQSKKDSPQ
jgi:hypothetical protein